MREWKRMFRQEGYIQVEENKFHSDINDETIVFKDGLVFVFNKGKQAPIKQSLLPICIDFINDNHFVKEERDLVGLLLENDLFMVISRSEIDNVYRTDKIKNPFKTAIISATSIKDKDLVFIVDSKGRAHTISPKEFKTGDQIDLNETFKKFVGPVTYLTKATEEDLKKKYLLVITQKNKMKRTSLNDFNNFKSSILIIDLKEDDKVIYTDFCNDDEEVILISNNSKALRLSVSEFPAVEKQARGYKAFDNQVDIVGAALVSPEDSVITSTAEKGKNTKAKSFPFGGRSTNGRAIAEGSLFIKKAEEEIIILDSKNGIAIMKVKDIPYKEYKSSGVKMLDGEISGIFT